LKNLVLKFRDLDDATKKQIVKYALLAAAIGPILIVLGLFLQSIAIVISSVIAFVGAIGTILTILPILTVLYLAWSENFLGIRDIITEVWDAFQKSDLAKEIGELVDSLKSGDLEGAKENLQGVFDEISRIWKEGYPQAVTDLKNALGPLFYVLFFYTFVANHVEKLADALSKLTNVDKNALIIIGVSLAWIGRKKLATGIWLVSKALLRLAWTLALFSIKGILSGISTVIGLLSPAALVAAIPPLIVIGLLLVGIVKNWENIKEHFSGFIDALKSGDTKAAISNFFKLLVEPLDGVKETIIDVVGWMLKPFGVDVEENLAAYVGVWNNIKTIFDPEAEGSLAWRIVQFGNKVWEWFGIDVNIDSKFTQPFRDAETEVEGILGALEEIITAFSTSAVVGFGLIGDAISAALDVTLKLSVIRAIQYLNVIIAALNTFPGVNIGLIEMPDVLKPETKVPEDVMSKESYQYYQWLAEQSRRGVEATPVPHRAAGGFLRGLGLVGERGPELAFSSGVSTIVPANLTTQFIKSMAQANSLTSRLMQSVIQHRQPVSRTAVYNPVFNGPPTREMVQTNLNLYDQWIMANQGV